MKKLPLFGSGVAGKSLTVTAQRRLNCYYDIRVDSDKANIVIYGTPGTTLVNSALTGVIRGFWVMGAYLYVVSGGALYQFDANFNLTTIGTLNTSAGIVSMVDNGTQLMIVDGVNGYIYNQVTTTWVGKITDADFPNGATTVTFDNGFFIVNKPNTGQFWKSASYDGTSWDGLDFATLAATPNNLLAVDDDHGYLILWGQRSFEFWQNNGASTFPYAPLRSVAQEFGLAALWSRAKVNNTIVFLAQNPQGQVQVMMGQGFTPTDISSPDVSNIINSFSVVSDAVALSYVIDGHPMYQINFPSAGRSFLYDCLTNFWSELQTGVGLSGIHIARQAVNFNQTVYACDGTTGNIYKVDPNSNSDNGIPILRLSQTRHVIEDMNVIGIDEIFFDMETGVGLQSGQGSNPQIMLQVSKDGGRTFGTEAWMPLGKVGQYRGPRVTKRRLGSARDIVLRIAMTDPVKFVITGGFASLRERKQ
jgi:hypothetical protein